MLNSILFRKYLLIKRAEYINFLMKYLFLMRFFHQSTFKPLSLTFISFLFWNTFNKFKHLTLQNTQFFLLKNSLLCQYHNLCNVPNYAAISEEKLSINFPCKLNSGRSRNFLYENLANQSLFCMSTLLFELVLAGC